jgi:hypothetical protein
MPLDNNKWDGIDRRAHLEDVDPVTLERRLGRIEGNVAVVTSELKSVAEALRLVTDELKTLAAPKRNWPEWIMVCLTTLGTIAVAIGLYVDPLMVEMKELKISAVRQEERLNDIDTQTARHEALLSVYQAELKTPKRQPPVQ